MDAASGAERTFQIPNNDPMHRQLLGRSLLHPWIMAKPSNDALTNPALGVVVVGLPAPERGSPDSQNLAELPLVEPQFFPLLMDMFTDSVWFGGQGCSQTVIDL